MIMTDAGQAELEQKESTIVSFNWLASKESIAECIGSALDFVAKTEDGRELNMYSTPVQDMINRFGHAGRDYEDFPESIGVALLGSKEGLRIGVNKFQVPLSVVLKPMVELFKDYLERKGIEKNFSNEVSSLEGLLEKSKEKDLKVNMKLMKTSSGIFVLQSLSLPDSSS